MLLGICARRSGWWCLEGLSRCFVHVQHPLLRCSDPFVYFFVLRFLRVPRILARAHFFRLQDSDVATDFQAALDTPEGRRKPRATPKSPTLAKETPKSGQEEEEEDEDGESGSDSEEGGGWGSDEF